MFQECYGEPTQVGFEIYGGCADRRRMIIAYQISCFHSKWKSHKATYHTHDNYRFLIENFSTLPPWQAEAEALVGEPTGPWTGPRVLTEPFLLWWHHEDADYHWYLPRTPKTYQVVGRISKAEQVRPIGIFNATLDYPVVPDLVEIGVWDITTKRGFQWRQTGPRTWNRPALSASNRQGYGAALPIDWQTNHPADTADKNRYKWLRHPLFGAENFSGGGHSSNTVTQQLEHRLRRMYPRRVWPVGSAPTKVTVTIEDVLFDNAQPIDANNKYATVTVDCVAAPMWTIDGYAIDLQWHLPQTLVTANIGGFDYATTLTIDGVSRDPSDTVTNNPGFFAVDNLPIGYHTGVFILRDGFLAGRTAWQAQTFAENPAICHLDFESEIDFDASAMTSIWRAPLFNSTYPIKPMRITSVVAS